MTSRKKFTHALQLSLRFFSYLGSGSGGGGGGGEWWFFGR